MSVRRIVMKHGRVVSVHGEQTQSRLLEKTHQPNDNLRKNDRVLMPKGEFKLLRTQTRLVETTMRAHVW